MISEDKYEESARKPVASFANMAKKTNKLQPSHSYRRIFNLNVTRQYLFLLHYFFLRSAPDIMIFREDKAHSRPNAHLFIDLGRDHRYSHTDQLNKKLIQVGKIKWNCMTRSNPPICFSTVTTLLRSSLQDNKSGLCTKYSS